MKGTRKAFVAKQQQQQQQQQTITERKPAMDVKRELLAIAFLLTFIIDCHADFVLRIAHTNDVHSRFEEVNKFGGSCSSAEDDECFGGVARRYTLIQELLQRAGPNLLFLDAGDQFQGTLWFNYFKGNATAHFMNKLNYDAMVRFKFIFKTNDMWTINKLIEVLLNW